jgi:hypothetical protein
VSNRKYMAGGSSSSVMISGMDRIRSITTITNSTNTSPAIRKPSGSIRNALTTSANHTSRARLMREGDNDSVGASPLRALGPNNQTADNARPRTTRQMVNRTGR